MALHELEELKSLLSRALAKSDIAQGKTGAMIEECGPECARYLPELEDCFKGVRGSLREALSIVNDCLHEEQHWHGKD